MSKKRPMSWDEELAIQSLMHQCALRESRIQRFFAELGAQPYSLFYEDLVSDFPAAVRGVLRFLGLDTPDLAVPEPFYEKLADSVSEAWAERCTLELQAASCLTRVCC